MGPRRCRVAAGMTKPPCPLIFVTSAVRGVTLRKVFALYCSASQYHVASPLHPPPLSLSLSLPSHCSLPLQQQPSLGWENGDVFHVFSLTKMQCGAQYFSEAPLASLTATIRSLQLPINDCMNVISWIRLSQQRRSDRFSDTMVLGFVMLTSAWRTDHMFSIGERSGE